MDRTFEMDFSDLRRAAPVLYKPCVTSTSTLVKALAAQRAAEGFTLVAARQTSGRGRLGRRFASPDGGLYLSMLLYPRCPLEQFATLTPCAGVAVCRAIERVCGVSPDIKWPNDLQLDGKKLCGILVETSSTQGRPYAVLGIGLNVNTAREDFPEELRDTATSLCAARGEPFALPPLARAMVEELDTMYAQWSADPGCCLAEYRRRCVSLNRPVVLIRDGERRTAFARDVDEAYALVVERDGAIEHIRTGEVSLRNA